eukprot:2257640-Amphidinium_carterae.2
MEVFGSKEMQSPSTFLFLGNGFSLSWLSAFSVLCQVKTNSCIAFWTCGGTCCLDDMHFPSSIGFQLIQEMILEQFVVEAKRVPLCEVRLGCSA